MLQKCQYFCNYFYLQIYIYCLSLDNVCRFLHVPYLTMLMSCFSLSHLKFLFCQFKGCSCIDYIAFILLLFEADVHHCQQELNLNLKVAFHLLTPPGPSKYFCQNKFVWLGTKLFSSDSNEESLILLHGLIPSVHFPTALIVLITLPILVHVFIDFPLLAFASLETVAQSLLLQFSLLSKQQFILATYQHNAGNICLAWQNRLTGNFTSKQTECDFVLRQRQVLHGNRSLTLNTSQNIIYQFPEFPVQDLLKREPLFNSIQCG